MAKRNAIVKKLPVVETLGLFKFYTIILSYFQKVKEFDDSKYEADALVG